MKQEANLYSSMTYHIGSIAICIAKDDNHIILRSTPVTDKEPAFHKRIILNALNLITNKRIKIFAR